MRSKDTSILIDSGLSNRELARRLNSIGARPDEIDAVIVSHQHTDHFSGVPSLSYQHDIQVYANHGAATKGDFSSILDRVAWFESGRSFTVGSLEITPFPVPHDAEDPVGFKISDGSVTAGIATDLGSLTLDILKGLSGCNAVIIESNHDRAMLMEGPYPWPLKKRVSGPLGHLSNDDASELIKCIYHEGLQHLVLAHLSHVNNRPELPIQTAKKALGPEAAGVHITLGWRERVGDVIRLVR